MTDYETLRDRFQSQASEAGLSPYYRSKFYKYLRDLKEGKSPKFSTAVRKSIETLEKHESGKETKLHKERFSDAFLKVRDASTKKFSTQAQQPGVIKPVVAEPSLPETDHDQGGGDHGAGDTGSRDSGYDDYTDDTSSGDSGDSGGDGGAAGASLFPPPDDGGDDPDDKKTNVVTNPIDEEKNTPDGTQLFPEKAADLAGVYSKPPHPVEELIPTEEELANDEATIFRYATVKDPNDEPENPLQMNNAVEMDLRYSNTRDFFNRLDTGLVEMREKQSNMGSNLILAIKEYGYRPYAPKVPKGNPLLGYLSRVPTDIDAQPNLQEFNKWKTLGQAKEAQYTEKIESRTAQGYRDRDGKVRFFNMYPQGQKRFTKLSI